MERTNLFFQECFFSLTCMCKNIIFGGKLFFVRSTFSCVRASYDLCARANAHSLEGTLLIVVSSRAQVVDGELFLRRGVMQYMARVCSRLLIGCIWIFLSIRIESGH